MLIYFGMCLTGSVLQLNVKKICYFTFKTYVDSMTFEWTQFYGNRVDKITDKTPLINVTKDVK